MNFGPFEWVTCKQNLYRKCHKILKTPTGSSKSMNTNDSRSTIIHMEKRSWDHFVSSGVLCCEASRLPTVEGSFCKNSYHTTERVYIANRCAHKDVSTHTERKFDDVCT